MKYFLYLFALMNLISLQLLFAQSEQIATFKTDQYGGPSVAVKSGNKLFFTAYDSIHGRELWCSDGTSAGTTMVADINPGAVNGVTEYFEYTSYDLNGILYFRGDDGITGIELWRSDGTSSGTYQVKDISSGPTSSSPGAFANVNNTLYFTAGTGSQLWRSDGTNAGTVNLGSFNVVTNLCGFNNKLYFSADNNNSGQELWTSDGTAGGTHLLKDLNGVQGASLPCNFHAADNILYFMACTNDGWELWKTNGTNAGTVQVADINPGGANGIIETYRDARMIHFGDTVYFRATNGVDGSQLWRSDGTVAGTMMLTSIADGIDAASTFPVVNNKVLVTNYASDRYYAYDIVNDTTTLTDYPGYNFFNGYANKHAFADSILFYTGKDSIYGCEVWRSDGTAAGNKILQETHLTDNWFPQAMQGFNSIWGIVNNTLLFSQARMHYNTDIPLFAYNVNQPTGCIAPSVIIPVPLDSNEVHLVWNRIEGAVNYELRYRLAGSSSWTVKNTNLSYTALNGLNTASDYEIQIRTQCNSGLTPWSDVVTYNTAFVQHDYIVNIIAERTENLTTERIYWLKTPEITNLQIRYRPYNTGTWVYATNATGMKKLTGLLPNTFYEYQYRAFLGGVWDAWYPSSRYFVTDSSITTSVNEPGEKSELNVYPNPTTGVVNVLGSGNGFADYQITDVNGRMLKEGIYKANEIDFAEFAEGMYLLKLISPIRTVQIKVIHLSDN